MKKRAAGLIMYRAKDGKKEILLVHPGGPFWKNRDDGVWSLPKGEADEGEDDLLDVAKREFEEETGMKPESGSFEFVGTVESPNKIVHVWAFEGDCDPGAIQSNMISIDWPPKSGQKLEIPEVDRAGFFSPEEAEIKLNAYQKPIVQMFRNKYGL